LFILAPVALLAVLSLLVPILARRDDRTPDRCWKAGIFYVNPADPALFVEKRHGIGYTLNFGNPWSWVVPHHRDPHCNRASHSRLSIPANSSLIHIHG
jgi:Family of unknown function (DUF5808)